MYTLTLTSGQRQAIDFVGDRYAHGDNLFDILMGCEWHDETDRAEVVEWDSSEDITFWIPEHRAWEINEIREDCKGLWDCFDAELVGVMDSFCDKIV